MTDRRSINQSNTTTVYYHRPGVGDGATKWLLYYEGGGWCANTQECYGQYF